MIWRVVVFVVVVVVKVVVVALCVGVGWRGGVSVLD